ncbi:vanin-like protein 2 [Agrilus planipennis]|uniref:Vanin-like protein 2 n=1 Tax=Agrilus planipennis TaxID=224129 RepID=A0A1W4XFW3_AGRPL|nr:vanin-like protein 2 [Agrilus planipennis]XP_025832968.1 vanin-like protein 2 [Agrilus planipennis]
MNSKKTVSISLVFLIIVFVKSQSTYKAAVVEFSPRISAYNPQDLLLENAAFYVDYIENAAELGVEIIVFPEDGLTGLNIWTADVTFESIAKYSTFVPEIKDEIAPCDYSSVNYYAKALIDLSCSARTNGIYTVINVLEKSFSSDNSTFLYNTDVVFDRNGVVIAKYRKVNLFNEAFVTPGNTTVTFQTDFGVTFAIFTCFDILFKNPSVDVLTDTISDVIYPVAWFSEVPFLQGKWYMNFFF